MEVKDPPLSYAAFRFDWGQVHAHLLPVYSACSWLVALQVRTTVECLNTWPQMREFWKGLLLNGMRDRAWILPRILCEPLNVKFSVANSYAMFVISEFLMVLHIYIGLWNDDSIVNKGMTAFELIYNPVATSSLKRWKCACVCVRERLMDNVAIAGDQRSVPINYCTLLSGSCHVAHPFVKVHFPQRHPEAKEQPENTAFQMADRNSFVDIAGG